MSSYINTNTTAANAAYNLGINQTNEQTDIQRLSSGLRINSAADDAAGLVISESLRAQSSGLTQATANTNDAINVVKTAEGALNEVHALLINIRQLVVHAANVGANDPTALKADQDAIASAVSSINRISGTTQFNNKNLLDGSSSSSSASFTAGTGTATGTGTYLTTVASDAASYGASAIASGNVVYKTGVANIETATFGTPAGAATDTYGGTFVLQGHTVSLTGGANTTTDIQTAILTQTGLNYTVSGSSATHLTFTDAATGKNTGTFATTDFAGLTASTASGVVTGANSTVGANAYVTVNGLNSDTINAAGNKFSFTTGALKGLSIQTNVTSSTANTTTIGAFSATADTFTAGQDLKFQIGANAGQTVSVSIGSTKAASVGAYTDAVTSKSYNLGDLAAGGALDITDSTGAQQQDALKVVDQAIADISSTREKLGALQSNVLQSNINTLGVAQQNTDASESTIRDTNLSTQIVDFTKNQILVQAGTSALAQANTAPQAILKLLQ